MKKGFTLVEMLAVIVILSLIAMVAIRSLLGVRNQQLENIANEKINNIAKAAILYGQDNPNIFNTAEKCSASTNNRVRDYADKEYCVAIDGYTLANEQYLDVNVVNNKKEILDDTTGINLLEYKIVLYRANNRVNSEVLVSELTNSTCPTNDNMFYYSKVKLNDGNYVCVKIYKSGSYSSYASYDSGCQIGENKAYEKGNNIYCCPKNYYYNRQERRCESNNYSNPKIVSPCPNGYVKSGSYCCPTSLPTYASNKCRITKYPSSRPNGCPNDYLLVSQTPNSNGTNSNRCVKKYAVSTPLCPSGKSLTRNKESCL